MELDFTPVTDTVPVTVTELKSSVTVTVTDTVSVTEFLIGN
jgi:hypothetical protein